MPGTPEGPTSGPAPAGGRRGGATRRFLRRLWARPLAAHAGTLAALLLVFAPFLHLGDTFTADEGAYALQVRALDRGGWEYDYRLEGIDPDGRWLALVNGARGDDGWFAYVKHPAYPLALLAATRVAGEPAGLYLFGLAGALGVAVAAWLLAAEIDARASRVAFWVAAASPVTVNAYLVWAHAPAAAVGGLALVGAARFARTGGRAWLALLLGLLAAGTLLRSEALLFAFAVAAGLLAGGLRGRPRRDRIGVPAACVAVALGAAAVEERWTGAILGRGRSGQGSRARAASVASPADGWLDWLGGRLDGAWNSLLRGSHLSGRGSVLVMVALVLVGCSVVAFRRRRPGWERDVVVGLAGAALLYGARAATGTDETLNGLVAAWPVALLALAGRFPPAPARPVVVAGACFAAAVLATQYRFGGGFEWGGRFFLPLVVPLAVLAALGLREVVTAMGSGRRVATVVIAVLAAVPVVAGLEVLRTTRPLLAGVAEEVTAAGPDLVLTHSPALPPAAWRTYPEVGWALVSQGRMVGAVQDLRARGVGPLLVVVPASTARRLAESVAGAVDVTGPAAGRLGWHTLRVGS